MAGNEEAFLNNEDDNTKRKKLFAESLIRNPKDPFKAALEVFPDNTHKALWAANYWVNDAEVISFKNKILETTDEFSFLPSKADLANDIWQRMQGAGFIQGKTVPVSADEYAKLAKLYAEVRGFIDKPQTTINTNVVIPKAIEVPVHENLEEWEKAAVTQQTDLLNVSRSKH